MFTWMTGFLKFILLAEFLYIIFSQNYFINIYFFAKCTVYPDPENPEGTRAIAGAVNMGFYISDIKSATRI